LTATATATATNPLLWIPDTKRAVAVAVNAHDNVNDHAHDNDSRIFG